MGIKELVFLLAFLPFVTMAADDEIGRREDEIRGNTLELKIFYAYRFQDVRIGLLDSLSDWVSGVAPVHSN